MMTTIVVGVVLRLVQHAGLPGSLPQATSVREPPNSAGLVQIRLIYLFKWFVSVT